MKILRIKTAVFTLDFSSRYIYEDRVMLIPTIEYFNRESGSYRMISLKFVFLKYWIKLSVSYKKINIEYNLFNQN